MSQRRACQPFFFFFFFSHTWFSQEDRLLITHVERLGVRAWGDAVKTLNKRFTAKQCRDRWFNYLSPDLNHGPWTAEEDEQLVVMQAKFGKKWAKIKDKIQGRTGAMCKVRWFQMSARRGARSTGSIGGKGAAGKVSGKRKSGKKFDDDDDEDEEDEEVDEDDDGMYDDEYEQGGGRGEAVAVANVQKRLRGSCSSQVDEAEPDVFGEAEIEEVMVMAARAGEEKSLAADNGEQSESSSSGESGVGMQNESFVFNGFDFVHGGTPTPFQSHRASAMFGSPFAPGLGSMGLHLSPGIMRLQKRQLFSPSVPEMTPVRRGDLVDYQSPSVAPFFVTPSHNYDALPSWMTPAKPALSAAHGVAAAVAVPAAPAPTVVSGAPATAVGSKGGFHKATTIMPPGLTRRQHYSSITQKFKDTPRTGGGAAGGAADSPMPTMTVAAVPATPLSDLPPVTLFNGGRHHPVQELLELLRRNDMLAVFEQAARFLKKHKVEEVASSELLVVAEAATTLHGPQLVAMSPEGASAD